VVAVREYALIVLVTAAVTYLVTPLVRRVAIAGGAMHAARDRDVHIVPIPRLGGLAMYAGVAAGLIVAGRVRPLNTLFQDSPRMAAGLLLAGGLIVVVGAVDDRWGLSPLIKLVGQVGAGGIVVWSGAQLTWLPEPNGGTLGLATINAVNFIDGLDGLAAGIVCIAAIAFFVYYYRLTQVVQPHLSVLANPALASAVLVGACVGFLPYNFYPARIFMGDTGSMLLGLLLAYVPISSIASLPATTLSGCSSRQVACAHIVNRFPEILPLLLPAAILVIPYADLLLAVVRRTRAGKSPLTPDRKHLHHRLLDIGHSHRSSVLIMYLWAALFSGVVVWLSIAKTPLFELAVITVGAVLVLLLMSMPRLRWWERGRRARSAAARSAVADHLAARSAVMSATRPGGAGPEDAAPRAPSGVSARPR
jgi:UDP-GlcNAc:undecaprenyl-phosphate GlcNAc-1-phosphate transferase